MAKELQIYRGTFDCYRQTVAKDGVRGLWLGWGPNVVRNSLINAAETSTYDQCKQVMLEYGYQDSPKLHAFCAVVASANAAIVGSPADIIKTRTMNIRSAGQAIGYFTLAGQILRKEGPSAFFKGLDALFFRLACWNVTMFIVLEQIKLLFYDPTLE